MSGYKTQPHMAKHEEAIRAFADGHTADALRILDELLTEHATSELWNDWATVQFLCGNHGEAQHGYSRSLELDPSNHQAELNLGLVHWNLGGRPKPAIKGHRKTGH